VRVNARRWHPYRHFAPVVSATPLAARVNVAHAPLRAEGRSRCTIHPTGPAHPSGSQRPGAASPERASVRLLRLTCRQKSSPGPNWRQKGALACNWVRGDTRARSVYPRQPRKQSRRQWATGSVPRPVQFGFPSVKIGRLQRVRCPAVQTPGQA